MPMAHRCLAAQSRPVINIGFTGHNLILRPPAQAADITGLLSYLLPFGIVPLPPFPSKIFAPPSLLRSFPPFPPKAFPPP